MKNNKVVLAYSGGLDTSYCASYLTHEQGFEVHAVLINTGGFDDMEIEQIEKRAYALGVTSFKAINVEATYFDKCIKYLIFGNILRNDTYPLSVSAERAFQALAVCEYAIELNADMVAHGSTGAGNDQVRFDLIFQSRAPQMEIITPIRDKKLSRNEEIAYLKSKGFDWFETKGKYSINKGLWGTSVGGAETLTSNLSLPEQAFPSQLSRTDPEIISIHFESGIPVRLNNEEMSPVELIKKLNEVASKFAIGRDTHVGDTIIGIKGRVSFEAAGAMIIIKSHQLLEKHNLTKWQYHWKKQLADWYGMLLHEGQYLEPVMRNIEGFMENMQEQVSGKVTVQLFPYRFELIGIESPFDLMQSSFGQYGEMNTAWSGEDVKGFTKVLSTASKIFYHVHPEKSKI